MQGQQTQSKYISQVSDELPESFAVFGLDVKITPAGQVKVIEVNGINSGMKGFRETGDQVSEGRLKQKVDAAFARMRPVGETKDTHENIERILSDKLQTDKLFDDCREIKTRSYEYSQEGLERLINQETPKHIILKPTRGSRGHGISILDLSNKPEYSSSYAVESFIPSKPILSSKYGTYHDGCMRYVVFIENMQGQTRIHHFGGYWRLCPNPISEKTDIDAMRANLALGAIPQKTSDDDLRKVKEAVERFVPIVYKNLILRANPTKRRSWIRTQYAMSDEGRSVLDFARSIGSEDLDSLSMEEIQGFIDAKRLPSVYANIRNVNDFYAVRWFSKLHDAETFPEFTRLFDGRLLTFEDNLGCLLQTMNFNGQNDTADSMAEMYGPIDQDHYLQTTAGLQKIFGIRPDRPAFFAQRLSESSLTQFISKWYGKGRKDWNPDYAPIQEQSTRTYGFCKSHTYQDIIKGFNLAAGHDHVVLPFDGWTLADLVRMSCE